MTEKSIDPQLHVAALQDNGSLRPYRFVPGDAEFLSDKVAAGRARTEALPNHEDGLNIPAVSEFFAEYGLETSPYRIVSSEDVNADELVLEPGRFGEYDLSDDIAVVLRDETSEANNGTVQTESTLVHELAHSSSRERHAVIVLDGSSGLPLKGGRMGFQTINPETGAIRGAFLEEGFAETLAGRYVSKATGSPNGVWGGDVSRSQEFGDGSGHTYELAEKYLFKDPDAPEGVVCGTAAIAAEGLDILIRIKPELLDAMIAARAGGAPSIRNMVQVIDGISPGLYGRIRTAQYTPEGFVEVLTEIRSIDLLLSTQKHKLGIIATGSGETELM